MLRRRVKPEYMERAANILSRREEMLRREPDHMRQLVNELAKLRATADSHSSGVAKAVVDQYLEALNDVPVWCVKAARLSWLANEWGDPKFPPKPAEMAMRSKQFFSQVARDCIQLRELIEAAKVTDQQPTEEERDFVTQGFEDLKAELIRNMRQGSMSTYINKFGRRGIGG